MDDLSQGRREIARWRILRILDSGRPNKVGEELILYTLNLAGLNVTAAELRRELDYLRDRGLVVLDTTSQPVWLADLTRLGVDIVEYTQPCEPGIARPPKW